VSERLRAAAEPYFNASQSSSSSGTSPFPSSSLYLYETEEDRNVWLAVDDVAEVLLVAGVRHATEFTVAETSRSLRRLLPGLGAGQITVQVSDLIE